MHPVLFVLAFLCISIDRYHHQSIKRISPKSKCVTVPRTYYSSLDLVLKISTLLKPAGIAQFYCLVAIDDGLKYAVHILMCGH